VVIAARLVPVIATDPKDSLAADGLSVRPCVGFVVVIAGAGLAHRIAGLIRSLADSRVVPHHSPAAR
jgi:hypothetical protein